MMIDDDDLFRPGVVPRSIIVHHHGVHGAVLFCIGGTCTCTGININTRTASLLLLSVFIVMDAV